MKRKLSYGYPIPSENSAEIESFSFAIGDFVVEEHTHQEPAWDYETPVTCSVTLDVDLPRMLRESGLQTPDDTPDYSPPRLAAALIWSSSTTKIRGASSRRQLVDGINQLDVLVDGQVLGGVLTVYAVITLLDDAIFTDNRIAPRSQGNIIWTSDELQLPLEGGGSRFTMTPVAFDKAGIEPLNAMWLVQLSDNFEVPISSGVRVLVNISHPITKSVLENPNNSDGEAWRKALESEVMTLLVHHGVSGLDPADYDSPMEVGSLGEGIQALMGSFFPREKPSDLINELPRISATIRAAVSSRKGS